MQHALQELFRLVGSAAIIYTETPKSRQYQSIFRGMNMMERRLPYCFLFGLSLTLIMPFAQAQTQGGAVRGNTNINVNAENINTIASGSGNVARTNIGSVKSGTRDGGNVTVDVKNVSNVVTGRGKKGCINIGVKGADPDCK